MIRGIKHLGFRWSKVTQHLQGRITEEQGYRSMPSHGSAGRVRDLCTDISLLSAVVQHLGVGCTGRLYQIHISLPLLPLASCTSNMMSCHHMLCVPFADTECSLFLTLLGDGGSIADPTRVGTKKQTNHIK